MAIPIFLLRKKRGWLRNIVLVALTLFFLSRFVMLFDLATGGVYRHAFCPISNSFYILAIPLLGYVYIRELSIEKQRAEEALRAHRDHLEDMVKERTAELASANEQLQREIIEREQAQAEIAQRNAELALLHQVSVFLTSTLDPARIYDQITQQAAKLLGCQMAFLFLWDGERQAATSVASCGLSKSGSKFIQVQPDEHDILHDLIIHRRTISIEDGEADSQIPLSWCQECDIKALLALPLWGKGKPLGILFLIDQRGPRQWLPDEVSLAESFVNLAAITLENVQLHKQVELTAALEERQRIAAEMHDGLAQVLSLIGLRTDRATGSIKTGCSQDAIQELGHVRNAVEQAAREVRRSIASLQKIPRPRQPLQYQLTEVVDKFSMLGGPPVEVINRVQDSLFLPPEHVEQVQRVVQEMLVNVRRHAHAQRITVYLEKQDDKIIVTVKDDGRGFDPNAPSTNGGDHFGLNIMRARATRIGGRVEIDSIPGQGTQVSLTWSSKSTPQISNTSLIANSLAQEGGA
jgi:two-component system nitrate/nitrite sensor histidine kinase NarX